MKKLLLLITCVVMLVGCQSKEEKAKELIKDHMFKTLLNFESYEPIEFSIIDSVFSDIYSDSLVRNNAYKYMAYGELFKEISEEVDYNLEIAGIYNNSYYAAGIRKFNEARNKAKEGINKMDEYLANQKESADSIYLLSNKFEPRFIGFKLNHRYRCKNRGGGFCISDYTFIFDPNIEKILSYYEPDNDEEKSIRQVIDDLSSEQLKD